MNNAVVFTKGKPTENANSFDTTISALIVGGVDGDKLDLDKVYTLTSIDDAKELLGLSETYDTTNDLVLFHHIDEFYRMSVPGTKLYLMVVGQSITPTAILEDATGIYAKKLIIEAKGEIRQLAIAYNPKFVANETEAIEKDLSKKIADAIPKAQDLAVWAYNTERPLHILLEGRSFNFTGTVATSDYPANLRNIKLVDNSVLGADKVSVVIGQDYNYASKFNATTGQKYAAVGTALGTLSGINVNQNIGEVETLNLSNVTKNKFIKVGLSSHTTIETAEPLLETLEARGYIFPVSYTGISGYRWNNDHVCAPVIVDEDGLMNESSIAYGRTMDDATRRLRKKLIPKIKSVQPVDNATGFLPIGIVKSFDSLGDEVFENMTAAGLISGGKTYTNASSDLLTEKVLKVSFDLQPTGSVNKIQGTINLKKTL